MRYARMPIEVESPEQVGYDAIRYNLAESSVRDRTVAELGLDLDVGQLLLLYGDHRGHPALRALLAAEGGCAPDQVLLTTGAAGALFIVATTLLEAGDHLVVLRPNYATNIETPRAIGANATYVELAFEDGWQWTVDQVMAAMTPRTRLVSVTTPHNPTGVVTPRESLARLAELVGARGAHLLVDETYRDLSVDEPGPWATTLAPNVISVASLSKAYGLPGLRLGWLMTRDPALNERFLAAKEQIFICGPILDEEIAYRVYARRATERPAVARLVTERRALVRDWIAREPRMQWVEPAGGVVCFPRIHPEAPVDVARFHAVLTGEHRTWVGPGHWFERDDRYMRIGFGWPTADELAGGLAAISAALDAASR